MPKKRTTHTALLPVERITQRIQLIRGQRVLLDVDLARLYGVPTKVFNQAIKRNQDRFPPDFRFQLSKSERKEVVTNCDHLAGLKFAPSMPWAFMEHGAIMAATVLNSPSAIKVSLFVVRAFVKLRELLSNHRELAVRLDQLERKLQDHDGQIIALIDAIRELMEPCPDPPREPIGFQSEAKRS